jgi:hypothetical protein
MTFNELVRLLEENGFGLIRRKDLFDTMAKRGGIGPFESIITGQKRCPPEPVMPS